MNLTSSTKKYFSLTDKIPLSLYRFITFSFYFIILLHEDNSRTTVVDAFSISGSTTPITSKTNRMNPFLGATAVSATTKTVMEEDEDVVSNDRRSLLQGGLKTSLLAMGFNLFITSDSNSGQVAYAQADCLTDCMRNCKLIAPKDTQYCTDNGNSYCAQEDRTDGLSGSVSSTGGETGILGQGTVPKGEDKPPSLSLPGLDFTSGKGRKLLGY